ncbi:MAG: hypothetical protein WDO12_07855 [Pseudomonadota bacterium]
MSPVAALTQEAAPASAPTSGIVPRIADGKRIYVPAQFTRFAPQTAADIVQQLPGFSVTGVSNERGLGEASQNVLINGQRITGKNNDAFTVLRRIPARAVLELQIIDAATLNIGGLTGDVLNVLTQQSAVQGNFVWRPVVRERIPDFWEGGEVNLAGKTGIGDFSAGLRWDGFSGGGWGGETETHPATDTSFFRAQKRHYSNDDPKFSASFNRKGETGSIWNINGSIERQNPRTRITTDYQMPGDPATTEYSLGDQVKWRTEIGTDYEFALGAQRLKLIGYFSEREGPNNSELLTYTDGVTIPAGSRFSQDGTEGERVGRAEYRGKALGGDWTLSGEAAYNFINVDGSLEDLDASGVYQPEELDGASARVAERRGESMLGFSRPLDAAWSLQLNGGVEYSSLGQSDAGGSTRRFWRPKGAVSLAWNPSTKWQVNTKLQRKVWQLNFFDFLASVDLQNDNTNGSNPALVPPQSWLLQVETIRNLGAHGKLNFKVEAEDIDDLVDQVPINATTEAPGNIHRAKRLQFTLDGTLLLDAWGIPGGKLDTFLTWRDTDLRDPLDGSHRQANGNRVYGNIDFRHDVPGTPWAYGFFTELQPKNHFYRLDYQSTNWGSKPYSQIFVENKDVHGLKVHAEIGNLLRSRDRSFSTAYVGRRDGSIDYTRDYGLSWGWVYRLQVSGTF